MDSYLDLDLYKLHLKLEWPGGPNDLDLVLGLEVDF